MKMTTPVKGKPEEKEARIDDTPAVPDELTDHAVARGRDVSLRCEGGHSPENHTVVLEWYWKPQTDRSGNEPFRPVQTAERVVVKYLDRKARASTANRRSHSGVVKSISPMQENSM